MGIHNKDLENSKIRGKGTGFERYRRITGYLVPSIDRWGDGKRAELKDRVTHSNIEIDKEENYESV